LKIDAHIRPGRLRHDFRHDLLDRFTPGDIVQWGVQANAFQTLLQSMQMRIQSEWLSVVDRNDFVDTITKQKATVHDRNARLIQWQILTVEIDDGSGDGGYSVVSQNRRVLI
jgi:hypothetical protein